MTRGSFIRVISSFAGTERKLVEINSSSKRVAYSD